MIDLVSVHIPKTGGATLGRTLRRKYGLRLRLDYPQPQGLSVRRLRADLHRATPYPRAVHGHFPASRYRGKRFITFVRDPVEARASAWHYIRRTHERTGLVYDGWQDALAMDLPAYLSRPRPVLAHFLDMPPDRFAFIGAVETFDTDMARLCRMLGVSHQPERRNANPGGSAYEVAEECREAFERANPGEMAIYQAMCERRSALIDALGSAEE